ncbi:MAG: hypothetical protein KA715_10885 [Xanthomonadaceae bacterium]|nr:hypothetical protein [Xanthomonadaceae bacterium]
MSKIIRMRERSKQILRALYEHGPLTNATLRQVISPIMSERRVNEVLQRLASVGLIKKRHSSVSKHAGRYLQLSDGVGAKTLLSEILSVSEESFERIPGGTEALEHWQDCVIWSKRFSDLYPDAKVISDFKIAQDKSARETLLIPDDGDVDLFPDLLLRIPSIHSSNTINIAVEVERSIKSKFRLAKKLKKFASRSRLDGVLYVCSNPKISDSLQRVYKMRVLPTALRIQHYGDNFLMFLNTQSLSTISEYIAQH